MPEHDGIRALLNRDIDEMSFNDAEGLASHVLKNCSGEDALLVLRDMQKRDQVQSGPDLFLIELQGGSTKVVLEQGNPDSLEYRRKDIGLIRADGSKQNNPLPNLLIENR